MAETSEMKHMVMSFRVSELQVLLGFAGKNKSGRKHELQARALQLLKSGCSTPVQIKIKDLYRRRFPRKLHIVNPTPSSMPVSNSQYSSTSSLSRSFGISSTPGHAILGNSSSIPQTSTLPVHPDVKLKHLPFYDVLDELIKPTSLVPRGSSKFQETYYTFHLSPLQVNQIQSSRDMRQSARIEYPVQVQLRFCLAETSCEQDDHYPPSLCVKVNGKMCPLPGFLPQTKAGQEPKRPSRAVNITTLSRLSPTVPNHIYVSWASEYGRSYAIAVRLVKQLTSECLLQRLRSKGIRNADHSRAMIKEKLVQDPDSEIATTNLRVSLLCPLGKMRICLPCRSLTCTHVQCFDASLYLQMNEKKPTWICPVCDKKAPFDSLVIDGLFTEILHTSPLSDDIQFAQDGSWAPLQQRRVTAVLGRPMDNQKSYIISQGDRKSDHMKHKKNITVVDLTLDSSDDDDDSTLSMLAAKKRSVSPPIITIDSPSHSMSGSLTISSSASSAISTSSPSSSLTKSSSPHSSCHTISSPSPSPNLPIIHHSASPLNLSSSVASRMPAFLAHAPSYPPPIPPLSSEDLPTEEEFEEFLGWLGDRRYRPDYPQTLFNPEDLI
ncbi:E3 SUMO-protein ligase PIAS2-like [Glandiceps talaboti]